MGTRLAAGLAALPAVDRLVLVERPGGDVRETAAMIASAGDCVVRAESRDGRDEDAIAELLAAEEPALVVQCGALQSPWALAGRSDPAALAVASAGLALRLPFQLPILLAVMRAARTCGYAGPVANLSLPDITHALLERHGLAPTIGLGNAGMQLLRVRAALRDEAPDREPPFVRVIGHHAQVYGVMQAAPPPAAADRVQVFVGEPGARRDELAYAGPSLQPGRRYNHVTACAALPVLAGLLPGSVPVRWSTPAPLGLPGGYPVRIESGQVELDLPAGLELHEVVALHERLGRGDGLERIDADGTVHFTEAAAAAVAAVAPDLAEPLVLAEVDRRAQRLDEVLG